MQNAYKNSAFLLTGILLLASLINTHSINFDFAYFDDVLFIIKNERIRELSSNNIVRIFTEREIGHYAPINTFIHLIEYSIAGTKAYIYHGGNIIFHLLNTILVFIFTLTLLKKEKYAFIITMMFAIHPLNIEAISWIAARSVLVYSFFYLFSLIYYLKYIKTKLFKYYLFCIISFILSLLSKSPAVTLPIILLVLDYIIKRKKSHKIITEKIPFFLLSLIFGIVTIINAKSAGTLFASTMTYSWLDRVFMVPYTYLVYIVKYVFPLHLSAIHPNPIKIQNTLPIEYYISPLILGILLYITIQTVIVIKRKKANNNINLLIGSILIFTISIAFFLQILPVGNALMYEKYTYLPYIGLSIFILTFSNHLFKTSKLNFLKPYFKLLLLIWIILFTVLSYNRSFKWKDELSLNKDIINKYSNRYYGYFGLGCAYLRKGEYKSSIIELEKSININPQIASSYNSKATALYKLNHVKKAEKNYLIANSLNPMNTETIINLAILYKNMGLFEKAKNNFQKALQLDRKNIYALINLGDIYLSSGNSNKAMNHFNLAVSIAPKEAQVFKSRGSAYAKTGDLQAAKLDFSSMLHLDYENDEAYFLIGNIFALKGNYNEALQHLNQAINYAPNNGIYYNNRGKINLLLKDTISACKDWRKSLLLENPDANKQLIQHCR